MSRDAHASIQHAGAVAPLAEGIQVRIHDGRRPAHASDPGPQARAGAGALMVSAALSLLLTACSHQPKMTLRGAEADAVRALAARVDRLAAEDEFCGAVLVAKDGGVLFSHAHGPADRKRRIPHTLRTRFRIGSMNKMFTAVARPRTSWRARLRTSAS